MRIFTKLGYMETCFANSMKELTPEVLEQLTTSEMVKSTMSRIEAEPNSEKKNKIKSELPVVLFACQMTENGERPDRDNGLLVPSGFCIHDWDHMAEDPRSFYLANIAGREEELHIVFAHVSPRGEGLRLVTVLTAGETIIQCQERLASLFGMNQKADKKIKDISRLSFLPSKDYVLYLNNEGLFQHECDAEVMPQSSVPATPVQSTPEKTKTEIMVTTLPQNPVAESMMFEGIKFSAIIVELLKRIATQGKPCEGERNNDLFMLVRELRHICSYNFQMVYMLVAPYFPGLQDAEIRRTISNAIDTNGRTITPVMRGVISQLKNENIDLGDDSNSIQLPKLPKLSAIEEMIISHYPKHLRSQVYLAMLPIWGVYGTHVRFDYMDGRENSLSFMTSVVGKSGSGKAFAAHLFDQMTKRLREADAIERQKADQYLAMCNKTSDNNEKPDDPRPRVRIYSDDITTSQLVEYLDNNKGEHGIQFTEEIARLLKAKRTIYGDNDDLYCKAFDNGIGGKESKSKLTRNIRIPIYLNTLFCGTHAAMHKFYNNPEGGLNNRVIFNFMPNVRLKGFPHYSKFTEEEQAQFDEVCDRLMEAGKDGKKIELPWLEKVIMSIKTKWDKEDDENPNEVLYDLGKRSLVVAMRAGTLEWLLRGCPEGWQQQREIAKVVRWVADAMREGVYTFCGEAYEQINESDNAYQMRQQRRSKNKKLFSLLGDQFTVQELVTLRVQNGDSSDVRMVLSRWVSDGYAQKVSEGVYKKIPQLVA